MALFAGMRGGGSGPSGSSSREQKEGELAMFRAEAEAQTDLIRRMVGACKCKCIHSEYKSPELELGEAMCIDRCVQKYYSAQNKVTALVTAEMQSQAMASAQMSGVQAPPGGSSSS